MKNIAIPLINLSNHGGLRVIVELSNYLSHQGHDVTLYIPKGNKKTVYNLSELVKIKEINFFTKNKNLVYALFLLTVWAKLKKHDVVIANFFPTAYPAFFAKLISKTKVYYFVQGIESIYDPSLKGRALNWFCNLTYKLPIHYIAANEKINLELQKFGVKNLNNINIGISQKFLEEKNHSPEKKYDVIYFLRPEPWKRKDRLHKVLNIYRSSYGEIKVLCLGQTIDLLEEVKSDWITAVRPKNDSELVNLIDQSKIILFTSEYEGFGLPPLECMARGLPAVSFYCKGTSNYIDNEKNSYIVENEELAAEKIYMLLNDPVLYESISFSAKKTSKAYSNLAAFERLNKILLSK